MSFNVEPADVPDNLQPEIIELRSNNVLKVKQPPSAPGLVFPFCSAELACAFSNMERAAGQ